MVNDSYWINLNSVEIWILIKMSKIWKQKTGLSNARRAMFYPLPRLGNKRNREENSIFISEIEIKKKRKKLFNTNSFFWSYHGSNSWMMLSNRITAKSRLAKPTSHAKERMVKVSKDCQPIVCVFASAEVIFPSFDPDASLLRSTSILEAGPRFNG